MERVAYRQMEPGNPSSLVQVKEELPSPGSGEVLMRIRVTSLTFRDVMMLSGRLPSPVKAGVVPLSDAAGEIIEVGASPEWAEAVKSLTQGAGADRIVEVGGRERWRNRSGPSHITVRCPSSVR